MSENETAEAIEALLPAARLDEFRARAPRYDAENAFFYEDLEALRASGYLAAPVPAEFGGAGLSLEQLVLAQRRLSAYAPATALGVNMHLVWVQVARFLRDRSRGTDDDGPLDWVLHEAVSGEIFAFGISEAGNDAVLMDSGVVGEPQDDGSYLVTGTKIFTTLSPVWTRLGVHARSEVPGLDPHLVFGFVRRDEADDVNLVSGQITHPGTWNPLGMRATQSWTTRLEGVRIAPADIAARIDPFDGSDPLVLAIFSSFSILTAAVYAGIADRALELAAESVNQKVSTPEGGETVRLDDPDTAARLTEAVLRHRESLDALTILARDIDDARAREDWFLALAAARIKVTDEARAAIDTAMRLIGGSAFQADGELARLYRDVLAGMFHPSNSRALAMHVRRTLTA